MAAAMRTCVVLALCLGAAGRLLGGSAVAAGSAGANPIRKVVTLMQNMQKEIDAEGAKEQELYEKFMCYCQNNDGSLEKEAADARAKIEELEGKIKSETAEKSQAAQEAKQHEADVAAAESDLNEATVLREKEANEFAASSADSEANIKALSGAVPALERGLGSASFLQTPAANRLRHVAESYEFTDDFDRKNVLAFLEQSGDYVPQSGQIVGILKGMLDSMQDNLKKATADEKTASEGYEELKASKTEEIKLGKTAIQTKNKRSGELALSLVEAANDLEDTEKELGSIEKLASTLKEQCGTKAQEWAERTKLRNEEIAAISEAIGILNDDDALDIFKKAVPATLAQTQIVGFIQRAGGRVEASAAHRAQAIIAKLVGAPHQSKMLRVMLLTLKTKIGHQLRLASHGKASNFGEVMKMVDNMVTLEGKEQENDDTEKPWCNGEFDKKDREEKAENTDINHLDAEIDEFNGELEQVEEDIATLKAEIEDLDKNVAEATETRKQEHVEYLDSIQLSQTAIELLDKAKNRLNKFYNPVLYKAPPVRKEMTMEEKIIDAGSMLAQVRSGSFRRAHVAPLEMPKTFGAYEKKGEKSSGVLGLMDMITKELSNDMKDAENEEKTAQADYTKLMADSQEARTQNVKSITSKEGAAAAFKDKRLQDQEKEQADQADLDLIHGYVADLHTNCDFIIENYDVRKEARTQEIESLKNAKAALSGANMR